MSAVPISDPPEDWQRPVRHYDALDKASIPPKLSAKLAGVSFAPGYPAILHRLAAQPERHLVLMREPDNSYDPNAVAVTVDGGSKVLGHLPRALAARIAPELDAECRWDVVGWEVLVQDGYEDRPGLSVDLERSA